MSSLPPQLDYAPPSNWRQRKQTRRAILAATLLLGLLASLKWTAPAWAHVRLLYYQHRCQTYRASTAQVVFNADSTNHPASDWEQFYNLFSPPGGRFDSTVFLGELHRPDGPSRLVAINVPRGRPSGFSPTSILFDIHVIDPASIWRSAELCTNSQWRAGATRQMEGRAFEIIIQHIHAGGPDPNRPDHFTISVDTQAGPQTIDGWLQKDDTILLEYRPPQLSTSN